MIIYLSKLWPLLFTMCLLEVYIEKSQFKTLFELWFKQLTMKKYWKGFQSQRLRHEWLNDNLKAAEMQKLHWKIVTAKRKCWNYLENFFVSQDRKLKFSASVEKNISWNFTIFQLIQLIQTILIFIFSIHCLIELIFFESFSFLSWKTKKFYS